jgi:hypothetical protein
MTFARLARCRAAYALVPRGGEKPGGGFTSTTCIGIPIGTEGHFHVAAETAGNVGKKQVLGHSTVLCIEGVLLRIF